MRRVFEGVSGSETLKSAKLPEKFPVCREFARRQGAIRTAPPASPVPNPRSGAYNQRKYRATTGSGDFDTSFEHDFSATDPTEQPV